MEKVCAREVSKDNQSFRRQTLDRTSECPRKPPVAKKFHTTLRLDPNFGRVCSSRKRRAYKMISSGGSPETIGLLHKNQFSYFFSSGLKVVNQFDVYISSGPTFFNQFSVYISSGSKLINQFGAYFSSGSKFVNQLSNYISSGLNVDRPVH